jgi:hypothetical protein
MIAKRYMHLSGATSEDFGVVWVVDRKHAAKNPTAYFYGKPITIEDYQNSRRSTGQPSSRRRRRAPARTIIRWSGTTGSNSTAGPRWGWSASRCGQQSRLKPTDIQTAILYDHFTPFTLIQFGGVAVLRSG